MDNPLQRVSNSRWPSRGKRRKLPRATVAPAAWRTRALRLEPLEARLVLSGESVDLAIGTLPAGASVTTEYNVTVDANIGKGDTLVQNQASATSTSPILSARSAAVDTTIDRAPQVTGVYVKSSTWSADFLNFLAAPSVNLGDATLIVAACPHGKVDLLGETPSASLPQAD
jgi:hypothetical protein